VEPSAAELGEEMHNYWDSVFSEIYPEKVDMVGRSSRLKAIIANQIETLLLTNATTHFWSRCVKTCVALGSGKPEAIKSVNAAFLGKWSDVSPENEVLLKGAIPADPQKNNVNYDMKARPSLYIQATFKLALLTKGSSCKGMESCPLRTTSIPCHVKLDTTVVVQCFVPYKEAVETRKAAEIQEDFNDWVWNRLLDRKKVDSKSRK
jgi:hypothetical protein